MTATHPSLSSLYESDETAWLEAMSRLAARKDRAALDLPHLAEYLSDMAKRDKREVRSRLVVLLAHLLKWQHQPDRRSASWQLTVTSQRQELAQLLTSRTRRNHASDVLAGAYDDAVEQAAIETRLPTERFPTACPFSLDDTLDAVVLEQPLAADG